MVILGFFFRFFSDKVKVEIVCGIKSKFLGFVGFLLEGSFVFFYCGLVVFVISGDRDGGLV